MLHVGVINTGRWQEKSHFTHPVLEMRLPPTSSQLAVIKKINQLTQQDIAVILHWDTHPHCRIVARGFLINY